MMNEKYIETERGRVYYYIKRNIGAKGTVVFCHGLTADHTLFDMQTGFFAIDYNVITWDMPLHGKSIPYSNFSLRTAAADLKSILDAERLSDIIIMAQSGGGYVAQQFIADYKGEVKAFVAIDTTPYGEEYYGKELYFIKHFADIAKLYPWGMYKRLSVNSAALTPESRASFEKALSALGKKGMLAASKAFYDSFLDFYRDVPEMDFPVLLILGAKDKTGYVERYCRMWSEKTGYPLAIIENAAHNSNYDNYAEFNRVVKEFLLSNNM